MVDTKKIVAMLELQVVSFCLIENLEAYYSYDEEIEDVESHSICVKLLDNWMPVFIVNKFDSYVVLQTWSKYQLCFLDRLKTSSIKELEERMIELRESALTILN